MEHDRIAELLRRTPAALPEPVPDPTALLRLYRGRRTRRLFASSLVAVVAAAGVVVPLGLLANVGSGPHPPSATISRPTTTGASALPTVANLTCTEAGIRVESPAFAVQPDGPHLDVDNPARARTLVLSRGRTSTFPIHLDAGSSTQTVQPFLEPGNYLAHCSGGASPQFVRTVLLQVDNPDGVWVDPAVDCTSTRHALVPTSAIVRSRDGVPDAIRASVVGIDDGDRIEAAGYPRSTANVTFLVRRGDSAVAVVRLVGRSLPLRAPGLDVTACGGSGIGAGQEVR